MGRRSRLAILIAASALGCSTTGAPATPPPAKESRAASASAAPTILPNPPSTAAGAPAAREDSSIPQPSGSSGSAAPAGSPTRGADGGPDLHQDIDPPPGALAWISGGMIRTKDPIFFELNKAVIRQGSFSVLDAVAEILLANGGLRVEIGGHTDRPPQYGMDLSKKRAQAVMHYLLNKGVDRARLKAVGYGHTRPLSDPREASGRARNRRIELVIER
jgi:outer membrane protein OmpA-like peptidoglycan-associated protein